jgi:predicted nucleotidyltransferase
MRTAPLSVEDVQNIAARVIRSRLGNPAFRIFLFGSRAAGTARRRSDIDIGIDGPAPVPYETMTAIAEDLEDVRSLYSVDVVDFQRVPERFRRVASKRRDLDRRPL